MYDPECPYCKEDVEINHDDGYGYEEDELHHQECPSCGKTFTFYTSISYSYTLDVAPCLNGDAPHNYEKTRTHPPEFATMRCTVCQDEKPLDFNDRVKGAYFAPLLTRLLVLILFILPLDNVSRL